MKKLSLLFAAVCLLSLSMLAATQHTIKLAWTAPTGTISGFNVYRSTTTGTGYVKVALVAVGVTTYTDASAVPGTKYYYVVTSLDTSNPPNESGYSNEVSAVEPVNPNAPTGLTAAVQ